MSYIDVVQHTSLSRLIHAWPYVTKKCTLKLEDEEAEIEMTGSQIRQESLGTSTFKMAEIEADDQWNLRELLHHGRQAGKEEKTEIRVVSGETNLILRIETYQL